jgi:hypothetical protein
MAVFTAAAERAGLPPWPITHAETIADEDDLDYGFEGGAEADLPSRARGPE